MIWRDHHIKVRFNPDHYVDENYHFCHIEVWCGKPLPITESGYRSHFTSISDLDGYESAEAFVLAWLDHEAQKPEWIAHELSSKQMVLF